MLLTESYQPSGRTFDPAIVGTAMGCVSSKADHDAGFADVNLFQVMNVDDSGRRLCPGQLEVSDSDLILYQRGKSPVRWPLRSLRRYGFDADLFSFECGRRCPTGPGIYAFHCRRAELLFNNVQARVAARHEEQDVASQARSRIRQSMPVISSSSVVQNGVSGSLEQNDDMDEEGSYLEPIRLQGPSHVWSPSSRPLSASSLISSGSSPISPPGNNLPNVLYSNNDAISAVANTAANEGPSLEVLMTETVLPPPVAYANMEPNHFSNKLDDLLRDDEDQQQHLYINVGPDAVEVKPRPLEPLVPLKQVNYVLLDLDKGSDSTTTASVTTHPLSPQGSVASFPESPHRTASNVLGQPSTSAVTMGTQTLLTTAEGYATIDFDRTAALSNTVASNVTSEEEGLRKTRHNSTMAVTNARLLTLNRQTSSVSD